MTNSRFDLSQIESFGAIDADADYLLDSCFQDHQAYLTVKSMRKFLVLGRKGSGKTAIYRKILNLQDESFLAIGQSFDDYPWNYHDLQAEQNVPEERRYIHSWKYLILIELAKLLLNRDATQPHSEEAQSALEVLEQFVHDSYGSTNPEFRQLFSPSKELHFKGKLGVSGLGIEGEKVRVRDLPIHFQEINAIMVKAVIAALNPSVSYFVLFDQLDLGFTTADPRYAERLTGLIIAAKDLFIQARNSNRKLNPVVFLRDDIYQDLQFEDKNKVTENYMTQVLWEEDGQGLTLKRLMERRFAEALEVPRTDRVAWDEVFDESKEMPSRQTKYKHICDRTFLRPRDVIKFCNEVLEAYKVSPGVDRFDNTAIHSARDRYSDYLLEELDDEIAKHVPKYKIYLEVLKSVESEKFSKQEFETAFAVRTELVGISSRDALANLFEFSVISYLKNGG